MKTVSSVAAALVLVAGLSSSVAARDAGNFVSVFDTPKDGVCWVDLHFVKGDTNDAKEEVEAAQAVSSKFGDFRGIRPDQVAKAHHKPCGKGKGDDVPPKEETKG